MSAFKVGQTYPSKNGTNWRSIYAEGSTLWCVISDQEIGNPNTSFCWNRNSGISITLGSAYDLLPPMPEIVVSDAVRRAVSVDYLPKGGSLDEETARAVIQAWLREHPAALEAFCAESRT